MANRVIGWIMTIAGIGYAVVGLTILVGSIMLRHMAWAETGPVFQTMISPGLLFIILGQIVRRY